MDAVRIGRRDFQQRLHRELRRRRKRLESFRGKREVNGIGAAGGHAVLAFVFRVAVQLTTVDQRHAIVNPNMKRVSEDFFDHRRAVLLLNLRDHYPGHDVRLFAPAFGFINRVGGVGVVDAREGQHDEGRKHLELHAPRSDSIQCRVNGLLEFFQIALNEKTVHLGIG